MKKLQYVSICLCLVIVLGMLAGCQSNPATSGPEAESLSEPQEELTFDEVIHDARVVVDGIVHTCDIDVSSGQWYLSADAMHDIFGVSAETDHMMLDDYAQTANIRYEQDEALGAAYFNTWHPYNDSDEASFDFERAFLLGLVPEDLRAQADEQIRSTDFRALLATLVQQKAPEQLAYFEENVTSHDTPMTRGMGFIMAYYAAKCIGADTFNNNFDHTRIDNDDLWSAWPDQFISLYPHCGEGPEPCGDQVWEDALTAAYLYSFWHSSPVSGQQMFSVEEETGKMYQAEPLTVRDAVSCVTRLYDSSPLYAALDDPRVLVPDDALLTQAHIAAAQENPEVTAENHPVWSGFIFGREYSGMFAAFPEQLEESADFGFNSARIKLDHSSLFSPDGTQANLSGLLGLDNLVATAIENNLHLNLCLTTLPGRTTAFDFSDYSSTGEFDLFTNPEKQELVDGIWCVLAERYRDVPSANLSFTPFWEAMNKNLSSGLPFAEYTAEDVGRYLARVLGVIREKDPDRLVIYEPTPANSIPEVPQEATAVLSAAGDLENTIISYNFCEGAYVYAGMTDAAGENIDNNNHSLFLPGYPNYIYAVDIDIEDKTPMTIDGLLPEGTVFDLYIRRSHGGTLGIVADGETLYSEFLPAQDYECGNNLSLIYPYAVSEKKVSVTLPADTEKLVLSCTGGCVEICGGDLYLPEEYAVEGWYYATNYDVYLGNETEPGVARTKTTRVMICPNSQLPESTHLTVQEDLSYTTEQVFIEASADTVNAWGDAIKELDDNCVVRFESADFSGTTWEAMSAYYEDLLQMCNEHGYSWWSNDWVCMTNDYTHQIAEDPSVPYNGYASFNLDLLRLLQMHQNSGRSSGT